MSFAPKHGGSDTDFARGEVVPFEELIEEILLLTAEDAEALGCVDEIGSIRNIMERGTSAHRQLKAFELAEAAGQSREDCLKAVVDRLVEDTAMGV